MHTMISWPRESLPVSPEILGGTPVFAGTRVPVQTFIEYIKAGESYRSLFGRFSVGNQGTVARIFAMKPRIWCSRTSTNTQQKLLLFPLNSCILLPVECRPAMLVQGDIWKV